MNDKIDITTPDGKFHAYVARPAVKPAAAVVVLQEIFGVNVDMRATCDELAKSGYLALCPDLFWRMEPGVEMSALNETEWKKGFKLYTAFDLNKGVEDIRATLQVARSMPGASGKVGVMGFCLGGLMAYLTAARVDVDAAVAYYPGSTEKHLEEASHDAGPMLMHLAEEDEYMPAQAQHEIRAALASRPQVQIYTYPGRNHAFARHNGTHFDAAAAKLANDRTSDFLALHLR